VGDGGMVDYRGLKGDRGDLDIFVGSLEDVAGEAYNNWSNPEKIAFWINAYNALTLRVIIDHYPIKSSFTKSVIYPKNSIRQIPGVWDELSFNIMGKSMTLNHIEHKILRKRFNEPRIHMALVCAAMSCPPIRNEPYSGDRLSAQLDDQTRRFVKRAGNVRIDSKNHRVYLSSIFKWFGDDFVDAYGAKDKNPNLGGSENAVLNFIRPYLKEADQDFLASRKYSIHFLKYNWTLNERKGN